MILPTKHLRAEWTLLGVGAAVLDEVRGPTTMTRLWARLRDDPAVGTYERLVLTIDLLFLCGALRVEGGTIRPMP